MSEQEHPPVAVVTVSDGVAEGVRDDASGRAVAALLEEHGFAVARRDVVSDERTAIASLLVGLAADGIPLIITTGGTGLGPRDVTPEATRDVIDREAPGLAEEMRAAGRGSTPFAALSRGVVGSRGSTLIVNLPGSERGATESLTAILTALPHALKLLGGDTVHGAADTTPPGESDRHVTATTIRVEGDPPCHVGQKLVIGPRGAVSGTLGCAEFDDGAVAEVPAILEAGRPATRTYTHELGSIEVFFEPPVRQPLLLVFSATPVARHLLRWGRELGFTPYLVEPRPGRLPAQGPGGPLVGDLADVTLDDDTAAVHTDHDAPGVAESVAELLRSPARFIGVMGSARHVGPHIEKLRRMGFTEEELARVRTPVGIDLGAQTAEEIALSILAGLVADRRGANGSWLDRRGTERGDGGSGSRSR